MQVSVFIATSLDGFIARLDGAIDWLVGDGSDPADYGYNEFAASVDALVIGRNTYDVVRSFPEWPYEGKRVIVLSRTLSQSAADADLRLEISSADPQNLVADLERDGCRRIYIDGGVTIQSFLREGLVTDMTITRVPLLLGSGLPLFGPLDEDLRLRHVETRSYPSGFVQSRYEIDIP